MAAPDISIVVLSWNTSDLLAACVRSLREDRSSTTREIIVVDNASDDGSADMVAADFPEVRLIRNSANLLYSEGNNVGARAATGEYLCLLNSDTEVVPGAIDRLRTFLLENPDYGIASPKLIFMDGRVQPACQRFAGFAEAIRASGFGRNTGWGRRALAQSHMHDFDHLSSRDVDQPPGACMMLRREEYLALGGLDPKLSLFYNDVDLCLRLRERGRKVRFLAEAEVKHHQGASTSKRSEEFGNSLWHANRRAFYRKHHGRLGRAAITTLMLTSSAIMFARIALGRRPWRDKRRVLGSLCSFVRRSMARPSA